VRLERNGCRAGWRGKAKHRTSSCVDRHDAHARAIPGADTGRRASPAFRRWTNRDDADAPTWTPHPATRARRLVARPVQSTDRFAGDYGRREVRMGARKGRMTGEAGGLPG